MRQQDELDGMRKTARLYMEGKRDASLHAIVETYKDRVRNAGDTVAALARLLAHSRREHPGPFHGVEDNVLVAALAGLTRESDTALAATLVGLALREASDYNWHRTRGPSEYQHRGLPVFMTGENTECPLCAVERGEDPWPAGEEQPGAERQPEAAEGPDLAVDLDVALTPECILVLKTMDEAEARGFQRFIAGMVTEMGLTSGRINGLETISQYVGASSNAYFDDVEEIVAGLVKMADGGIAGQVAGLTGPDAVQFIGHLMARSKSSLAAALYGVGLSLARLVKGETRPGIAPSSRARAAALMEELMTRTGEKR